VFDAKAFQLGLAILQSADGFVACHL
jgi:hypothetical protein